MTGNVIHRRVVGVAAGLVGAVLYAIAGSLHAAAPAAGRAGFIEGTVTFEERAARRTLNRYGSGAAVHTLQQVPAIAYLEGRIPGAPAAARPEVAQVDTAFAPALLVVPVGTTVSFPNRDPFFHNVFSYS